MASKSKLVRILMDGATGFAKTAGAVGLVWSFNHAPIKAQNIHVDSTYAPEIARDLAGVYSSYLGLNTQIGGTPSDSNSNRLVVIPLGNNSNLGGSNFYSLVNSNLNNVFVIGTNPNLSDSAKDLLNLNFGDTNTVEDMRPVNHCNEIGSPNFHYSSYVPGIHTVVPNDSFYGETALVTDDNRRLPLGVRTDEDGLARRMYLGVDIDPEIFGVMAYVYLCEFGVSCLDLGNNGVNSETELPEETGLLKSYPNPFNSSTRIFLNNLFGGDFELDVYNPLGQNVETLYNGFLPSGNHSFDFSPKKHPSGVYFIHLRNKKTGEDLTDKVTYLK